MSQNFTNIGPEADIRYSENGKHVNNSEVLVSPLPGQSYEEVLQQVYANGFIPSEINLITPGPDFSINMIGNNKGSFWFPE